MTAVRRSCPSAWLHSAWELRRRAHRAVGVCMYVSTCEGGVAPAGLPGAWYSSSAPAALYCPAPMHGVCGQLQHLNVPRVEQLTSLKRQTTWPVGFRHAHACKRAQAACKAVNGGNFQCS